MNLCMRKQPFFGIRPGSTQTGLYSHRRGLEAWNSGFRKNRNYTIRVAKTKALIRCALTAHLMRLSFHIIYALFVLS